MREIHGRCLECGATITLPMRDTWNAGDTIIQADRQSTDENMEDMLAFLHDIRCPRCGEKTIRVALPAVGEE